MLSKKICKNLCDYCDLFEIMLGILWIGYCFKEISKLVIVLDLTYLLARLVFGCVGMFMGSLR